MPNLASAKKNLRKSKKRQTAHRFVKERVAKLLKEAAGDLKKVQSLIDKAAKNGIFHKNKAGRLVAKLVSSKKTKA